jgi:hypothetical protein
VALARKPFVVLDAEILSSSVWSEPAHVRLVWITLLILCDTEGNVGASIPGIASAAGVTVPEAENALEVLQAPDPYSRTKANDGRRLEVVDRGFRVLNYLEQLDRLSADRAKTRDRLRRWREKKRRDLEAAGNVTVTPGNVTGHTGSREQGTGNREQGVPSAKSLEVGREVVAPSRNDLPPRPPTERAETAVTDEIRRLQNALGAKLAALSEHPNSRDMVSSWTRRCTSYRRKDGTQVNGIADYRTLLSIDRLEKSIADADKWLGLLERGPIPEARRGV